MNNDNDAKTTIRGIFLKKLLVFVLYVIVVVYLLVVHTSLWTVLASLILYVFVVAIMHFIETRTLLSILFKELDAEKLKSVISYKYNSAPFPFKINAAIFNGDYQTTTELLETQLKKRLNVSNKSAYYAVLAHVYFEQENLNDLQRVCDEYSEFSKSCSKNTATKNTEAVWQYYEHFLAGDYDSCVSLCLVKFKDQRVDWRTPLTNIITDYRLAVAYYYNNDFENARKVFESIVQRAPKLYFACLAKEYLAKMQEDK